MIVHVALTMHLQFRQIFVKNMPTIELHHNHQLDREAALGAVQQLATRLEKEYGIRYRWNENALNFERPGLEGNLALLDGALRLQVTLGFLLLPMAAQIEQKLKAGLSEAFAPA